MQTSTNTHNTTSPSKEPKKLCKVREEKPTPAPPATHHHAAPACPPPRAQPARTALDPKTAAFSAEAAEYDRVRRAYDEMRAQGTAPTTAEAWRRVAATFLDPTAAATTAQ